MATTSRRVAARVMSSSENTEVVGLGGGEALALGGDHVHDHRGLESPRVPQRRLDRVLVVSVDRAHVLQAEVGEHDLRRQRVLDADLDAVHALVEELAEEGQATNGLAALLEQTLVARLQAKTGEMVGEAADRRRVAAAVVVDDDDHRALGRGDVVQRFPAHAARQGAVTDDRDHVAVAVTVELVGLGQAVGVGQRGAGMAGLHPVVLALAARRIAGQPTLLAQVVEVRAPTGEHLVDVGLMAGVEDDRVARRVEDPVQGECQLDDAQVGAEMSASGSNLGDEELADLQSEIVHLGLRQALQISGTADL
jgi:hypothetical protein